MRVHIGAGLIKIKLFNVLLEHHWLLNDKAALTFVVHRFVFVAILLVFKYRVGAVLFSCEVKKQAQVLLTVAELVMLE